jgi:hypothetical protein
MAKDASPNRGNLVLLTDRFQTTIFYLIVNIFFQFIKLHVLSFSSYFITSISHHFHCIKWFFFLFSLHNGLNLLDFLFPPVILDIPFISYSIVGRCDVGICNPNSCILWIFNPILKTYLFIGMQLAYADRWFLIVICWDCNFSQAQDRWFPTTNPAILQVIIDYISDGAWGSFFLRQVCFYFLHSLFNASVNSFVIGRPPSFRHSL